MRVGGGAVKDVGVCVSRQVRTLFSGGGGGECILLSRGDNVNRKRTE